MKANTHPLIVRLETNYDETMSLVRTRAMSSASSSGETGDADFSVSPPSPGFVAAGLPFNPIVSFHTDDFTQSSREIRDAIQRTNLASGDDSSLAGLVAIYDIRQPGYEARLSDSRFNPSLIYGKSYQKSATTYENLYYKDTGVEKDEFPIETRFSGKLLLAAEDFALWRPNGRWQQSKARRSTKPAFIYIEAARVSAIPWIQTNSEGKDQFMADSLSFRVRAEDESFDLHERMLDSVTTRYAQRTDNAHYSRKDIYLRTVPDGGGVFSFEEYLFSPDPITARAARKAWESDYIGLFGYQRTSSKPIQDSREETDVRNARQNTQMPSGRTPDPTTRVYSSCCTPFVGKPVGYRGPKSLLKRSRRGDPGLTLLVRPLVLSLPSWLRPRDNGLLTGVNLDGQKVELRTPTVDDDASLESSVDATTVHTRYLDLPNINYELSILIDMETLQGIPGALPVLYTVRFRHVDTIEVNEAVLGDEEKASYLRQTARQVAPLLTEIDTTQIENVPDMGIYDPNMPERVKESMKEYGNSFSGEFKERVEYGEAKASMFTPHGSILFFQAFNTLIDHVASRGRNALNLSIEFGTGEFEELYPNDEGRPNPKYAKDFETGFTTADGRSYFSSTGVFQGSSGGSMTLTEAKHEEVTARIVLDSLKLKGSVQDNTSVVLAFMELLSALCATERGVSPPELRNVDMNAPVGMDAHIVNWFEQWSPTTGNMEIVQLGEGREYDPTSVEAVALMAYLVQQSHEASSRAQTSMASDDYWIEAVRSWTSDPATAYTGGMSPFLSRCVEMGGAYARNLLYPKLLDYGIDVISSDSVFDQVLPLRVPSVSFERYLATTSPGLGAIIETEDPSVWQSVVRTRTNPWFVNIPRALMAPPGVPMGNRSIREGDIPPFRGSGNILTRRMDPFGYATPHGSLYTMPLERDVETGSILATRKHRTNVFSDMGNAFSVHVRPDLFSIFFVPTLSVMRRESILPSVEFSPTDKSVLETSLMKTYGITMAIQHEKEPYAEQVFRVAAEASDYLTGIPVRVYTVLNVLSPIYNGHVAGSTPDDSSSRTGLYNQVSRLNVQKYVNGTLRMMSSDAGSRYYLSFVPAMPLFNTVPTKEEEAAGTIRAGIHQTVRLLDMINTPTQESPVVTFFVIPSNQREEDIRAVIDNLSAIPFKKNDRTSTLQDAAGQGVLLLERKLTRNLGSVPTSHVSLLPRALLSPEEEDIRRRHMFGEEGVDFSATELYRKWNGLFQRAFEDLALAREIRISGYQGDPLRTPPPPPPTIVVPKTEPPPERPPSRRPRPRTRPRSPPPLPPRPVEPPTPVPEEPPVERLLPNMPTLSQLRDLEQAIRTTLVRAEPFKDVETVNQARGELEQTYNDEFRDVSIEFAATLRKFKRLVREGAETVDMNQVVLQANRLWAGGFQVAYELIEGDLLPALARAVREEERRPRTAPLPRAPLPKKEPMLLMRGLDQLTTDLDQMYSLIAQLRSVSMVIKDGAEERVIPGMLERKNAMEALLAGPLRRIPPGARGDSILNAYERERRTYERKPTERGLDTLQKRWTALVSHLREMVNEKNAARALLTSFRESGDVNFPGGLKDVGLALLMRETDGIPAEIDELRMEIRDAGLSLDVERELLEDVDAVAPAFMKSMQDAGWDGTWGEFSEPRQYRELLSAFIAQLVTLGEYTFDESQFAETWNAMATRWNERSQNIFTDLITELKAIREAIGGTFADTTGRRTSVLGTIRQKLIDALLSMTSDQLQEAEETWESVQTTATEAASYGILTLGEAQDLGDTIQVAAVTENVLEESLSRVVSRAKGKERVVDDASMEVAESSHLVTARQIQARETEMVETLIERILTERQTMGDPEDRNAIERLHELLTWKEGDPLSAKAYEFEDGVARMLGERYDRDLHRIQAPRAVSELAETMMQLYTELVITPVARPTTEEEEAETIRLAKQKVEPIGDEAREEVEKALADAEAQELRAEDKERKARREAKAADESVGRAKEEYDTYSGRIAGWISSTWSSIKQTAAREAEDSPAIRAAREALEEQIQRLPASIRPSLTPPPPPITPPTTPSPTPSPPISPRLRGIDDRDIRGATREFEMQGQSSIRVRGLLMTALRDAIVTQEQMTERIPVSPRAFLRGYGPSNLDLRMEFTGTDNYSGSQEEAVLPIVRPLVLTIPQRLDQDLVKESSLACVAATFADDTRIAFSRTTIPTDSPFYERLGAQALFRKFPIDGVLDIVVGRSDMGNFDARRVPMRERSGGVSDAYMFTVEYRMNDEGKDPLTIEPGTHLMAVVELVGRTTPAAEGALAADRTQWTSREVIAQLHISGVKTEGYYVRLTSILFAFHPDAERVYDWYKTLEHL